MKTKYTLLIALVFVLLQSCKEEKMFENPYEGGIKPLDVKFNSANAPVPAEAAPGSVVTFTAEGLVPFKNELTFSFNGEAAEIISVGEKSVTVKVPEYASSGAASIAIGDQIFFGPQFKVIGKVSTDPFYKGLLGANGEVRTIFELKDGRYILGGSFTNYNNQANDVAPIRRVVLTSADGEIDRSFRFGQGANGTIYSIAAPANQNKFYLAGSFSAYDKLNRFINNITSTLANGTGDSIKVLTSSGLQLSVPAFNGGTNATINKIFYNNDKVVAVGNFQYYITRNFQAAKKPVKLSSGVVLVGDSVIVDSVEMKQVLRFNLDGSLDKTYRYNAQTGKGLEGGNSSIVSAYMQADGRLVIIGNFTRFDGENVGRIVRLNTDGTVDKSFNSGTGANGSISSITYNEQFKRFLITGTFGSYNGAPVKSLAMLREDGSLDNSFVARDFDNGFPAFAKQLSNGLIVVSGGFRKYSGIKRAGLIYLTPAGNLAAGYNTTGEFSGQLYDVVERKNTDGKISLTLPGSYTRFDGKVVNNINSVMLE